MANIRTNNIHDFTHSLKANPVIRIIMYPWCTYSRGKYNRLYADSCDAKRLEQWKDVYSGQTCWVIGNGPSLTTDDLNDLNGQITFAANRIYHMFDETLWRPNFYVAFEPDFVNMNAEFISQIEVKDSRFINICGKKNAIYDCNNYWLNCTSRFTIKKETIKNIEFSDDITQKVNDAYSVTFTILQIAFFMGFKNIYLLGVDHYKTLHSNESTHFYLDTSNEYRAPTYVEGIEYGYKLAKEVADRRGIHIYNATRGGNLEVFERVDFDSVIK